MRKARSGRVVVIGGSIAGLLTARVLSDVFEQVTVLDRDVLPDTPQARRAVPQGEHVHGLLTRGRQVLDELFAGLTDELVGLGAVTGDVQQDLHWWLDGKLLAPAPSGMISLSASRPLLELVIRRRVTALPNVSIHDRHTVRGLLTTPGRERVTGVLADTGNDQLLIDDAGLVVDASGRGSRSKHWLTRLGYPQAEEERIETDLSYVTGRFRREPHHLDGRVGTVSAAFPGQERSGLVLAQENDAWILSVGGLFGATPPTDVEGMAAWADAFAAPDIATIIRTADPLGPSIRMRFPASKRTCYERMRRFPAGYLVLGDALCSFNPVYGQGMTVAALEAVTLGRLLTDGADELARRFFTEAAEVIDVPWATAANSDLRFSRAKAAGSPPDPRHGGYLRRLREAAVEDPVLARAHLRVTQMLDPPTALFAPEIVARVRSRQPGMRCDQSGSV